MSRERITSGDPLVQLFLELARIPSPSGKERQVVDYIAGRLRDLGLETSEGEPPQAGEGAAGNLYCRIPGNSDGVPVLLSAHTDTVFADPKAVPEPLIRDGMIISGSRAVLGADDKAAVAAIIHGVETVVREGLPHAGIELMLTACEENGLRGAKMATMDGIVARCGFCLDSTGPVGEVIVRSPSQKTIRAVFTGKAAHAIKIAIIIDQGDVMARFRQVFAITPGIIERIVKGDFVGDVVGAAGCQSARINDDVIWLWLQALCRCSLFPEWRRINLLYRKRHIF